MRLLILITLLCCAPMLAQWGGDSRFYRTSPISREGLIVDLDFSQFSYSGNVYTIRNMANAAAPAYMYGGLSFNSVGSDSSGLSRDIHTGRVVMAMDGSAGDSATVTLTTTLDSTSNWEVAFEWSPGSLTRTVRTAIITLRWDTTGASYDNYSVFLEQFKDTLFIRSYRAPGTAQATVKLPGFFTNRDKKHYALTRNGLRIKLLVNEDSTAAANLSAGNYRPITRLYLGALGCNATYHSSGKFSSVCLYSRALSSAERLTLYENATRDNHSKKKFSRW